MYSMANTLRVVNIADPANLTVHPSTPLPSAIAGFLRDVTVKDRFALGADIFFVNGVPMLDVEDLVNPIGKVILNFAAQFGFDGNGNGIATDGSYLYLVTYQNRLFIGQ